MTASRLYPERPYLAASVAVLRDGKVLLAQRAHPPAARVFSLPGGVVEAGETVAEAALRELGEEVGVEAEIIGALPPLDIIDRDDDGAVRRHFVVCPHAARWLRGEPRVGVEALDIVWLAEDEVAALGAESARATTPGLPGVLAAAFALARRQGCG